MNPLAGLVTLTPEMVRAAMAMLAQPPAAPSKYLYLLPPKVYDDCVKRFGPLPEDIVRSPLVVSGMITLPKRAKA